jgi:Flp pilus assembly protein TadG
MRFRIHPGRRKAAALVELALILPLFAFILVAATDFARIYYIFVTVTDCARNGALYACQNSTQANPAYTTATTAAAVADASNLSPTPTVSAPAFSTINSIHHVTVSVTYNFTPIIPFPGIPSPVAVTRSFTMRVLR